MNVGIGVRDETGVAVLRGVMLTSGASVSVGSKALSVAGGWHAAPASTVHKMSSNVSLLMCIRIAGKWTVRKGYNLTLPHF